MANARRQRPEWDDKPYNNSKESYGLFDYLAEPREAIAADTITYRQIGALLETYVDALHVPLVLEEKNFLQALERGHEGVRDPSFFANERYKVPGFIREALGDYRAFTSFFRNDLAMVGKGPWAQTSDKNAQAAMFAQVVHGQLRKSANDYGAKFEVEFFPPHGQGGGIPSAQWQDFKQIKNVIARFKHWQGEYADAYKQFRKEYEVPDADLSRRMKEIKRKAGSFKQFIESDKFKSLEAEIWEAIDDVVQALRPRAAGGKCDSFILHHNGQHIKIDNTALLDNRFSLSYPSLIILSIASKGKHDADMSVASKPIFRLFSQALGVESQITVNLQHFHDSIIRPAFGVTDEDVLYDTSQRAKLVDAIKANSRGMQLLYTFHKTAGQLEKIFPEGKEDIAYGDMRKLLNMGGIKKPWLETIERPCELASLLYALERRAVIGDPGHKKMPGLNSIIDRIGKCHRMEEIRLSEPQMANLDVFLHRFDEVPELAQSLAIIREPLKGVRLQMHKKQQDGQAR